MVVVVGGGGGRGTLALTRGKHLDPSKMTH